MAETTFNRELGAAPAGITRFGQLRTEDGGNVTVDATREFASDGSYETADVFTVTSSATGTGTVTLFAGSKSVGKVFILSGVNGSVLGEVDALRSQIAQTSRSHSVWVRASLIICT